MSETGIAGTRTRFSLERVSGSHEWVISKFSFEGEWVMTDIASFTVKEEAERVLACLRDDRDSDPVTLTVWDSPQKLVESKLQGASFETVHDFADDAANRRN